MIDFTPAFRLYAHRRRRALAAQDAVAAQSHELRHLIARAENTRFGRDHGFGAIRNVADFQRAVPLRRYEELWSDYWQQSFPKLTDVTWPGTIPFFAVTSGTTSGTSKHIPVSHEMNRANTRAALDLLVHHLAHRPHSRALGGKNFMLGGSTELVELSPGIFSGDLSGIAVKCLPWWLRGLVFPPAHVARETDWEKKTEQIAALAPNADIRVLGGTPPWLLRLFARQQSLAGRQLSARTLYPKLEMLVHGGVNFKPYRERFEVFLEGGAELRELYAASEGFIALQDETPEAGLRLMTDNGLFFEFVPLDELDSAAPVRHTLADAEIGVNYAIVVSSCAGAWAYIVGDTVRFVSRAPPRIMITGRTSYFMSFFGEHLIGEEIEDAVSAAASAIGTSVTDFSMGAIFPERAEEVGGHLYVVEFAPAPVSQEKAGRFATTLDASLVARNDDYAHYRADSRIAAPQILIVPEGTFAAWMKARGRLGGQNKVPRIINDGKLFGQLRDFAHRARNSNGEPRR